MNRSRSGGKPDARTERWREHRVKVRAEFVDAAFRALDRLGPDVSMGDIAREAGAAKPKLYRHFEDKADLHATVVERVSDVLWERILLHVDLGRDAAAELVRRGVAEYALVVDEHPNVFRFLVHGHFARQADASERTLDIARRTVRRVADMTVAAVDRSEFDADDAEVLIAGVFGAVASVTEWWLGTNDRALPIEEFVRRLNTLVLGMVQAALADIGFTVDTGRPLAEALGVTS